LSLWKNRPDITLRCLGRKDIDLAQPDEVRDVLEASEFDILINPAAVSGLEQCLDHPEEAYAVNALSPGVMAAVCEEKGCRLVHFSTDYVFGGETSTRLDEGAVTHPVNIYGRTKEAGEQAILAASPSALICRVSWLFGPGPASHFDSTIERARRGEPMKFITDKFSVPTYTHDIVAWVEALLTNKTAGIYHLCNAGEPESWHSYSKSICQIAQELQLLEHPPQIDSLRLADAHFFRDPRPQHTAMLPQRLISEGIVTPRHWKSAAEDYLKIR
ncbi:MAG: SDR family oxidoreductase, partial [Akkermansiaceae bacterium]